MNALTSVDDRFLDVAANGGKVYIFSVQQQDGSLTQVGTVDVGAEAMSLGFASRPLPWAP